MAFRSAPISSPANTAHSGRGPLAVLRRAKSVKNAAEAEREVLLEDAERIETWSAWLVLSAIVLEAVTWASPLCPFLFKLGNFVADAAVAVGIYGEMRFGHVVADILKIRLAEAIERASAVQREFAAYKAGRDLTEEQYFEMVKELRPFAGQKYVTSSYSHQECKYLEFRIDDVLQAADWERGYDRVGLVTFRGAEQGIQLTWHQDSDESTKQAGLALWDALLAARLGVVNWSWHRPGAVCNNTIDVRIGTKH
jgi:hypothetical protein